MTPEFIQQTAIDYDMTLEDVKEIYVNTQDYESFYDKLEEWIERRAYSRNNGL